MLAVQESHRAALSEQVEDLRRQESEIVAEVAALCHQRDQTTNALAALRQDSARLRAGPVGEELKLLEGEAERWRTAAGALRTPRVLGPVSRVALLKQRLERMPEARIPEFQFLTPEDWLAAASGPLGTDEDFRRALAALRATGQRSFAGRLRQALDSYIQTHPGGFPADISELRAHFNPPVEEALLDRWKVAPKGELYGVGEHGSDFLLTQKGPVDEDYDACFVIGAKGEADSTFKNQRNMRILAPVFEDFEHSGLNTQMPISNGRPDLTVLKQFVKTPEQQAAFEFFEEEIGPPK
jgi:hypothetical protein